MKTLLIILILSLTSCGFTTKGNIIRDMAASKGADAADQAVQNALFVLCKATSVGSINRWLDGNVTKAGHYHAICTPDNVLIGRLP